MVPGQADYKRKYFNPKQYITSFIRWNIIKENTNEDLKTEIIRRSIFGRLEVI